MAGSLFLWLIDMKFQVLITGWDEGLDKVALAMIQVNLADIQLHEAKRNVDGLLDGQPFTVSFNSYAAAKWFQEEVVSLKARASVSAETK